MASHPRETIIRPAPVLSQDERDLLEREAGQWGDRQRQAFAADVEMQALMASNPDGVSRAIAEWLADARAGGLLPPEVTTG